MTDISTPKTAKQKQNVQHMSVCAQALLFWVDRTTMLVGPGFAAEQLESALRGIRSRLS